MSGIDAAVRTGELRVTPVIQGEFRVSGDPHIVLTTILGSCVATCLHDPVAKVGGMNHFLLPEGDDRGDGMGIRYGLLAMELLINGMLKGGAERRNIEAKLFGGAILNDSLARIGEANSAFALKFLRDEGIRCRSKSLGGNQARRIRFVPATGSAQQMMLSDAREPEAPSRRRPRSDFDDDVTLF